MSAFPVLTTGCKAFVDSFAGLLSCTVLRITGPRDRLDRATSEQEVEVVLTADHGPYRKGETMVQSALWVIPPKALRRHQYSATIGPYHVHPDPETT